MLDASFPDAPYLGGIYQFAPIAAGGVYHAPISAVNAICLASD